MLLEHQAAMKLARKLAQKIGAEPEKFGELARKAAQAPEGLACGLNYGPIPLGAAGKALNFMHWAVNGVRPYPEEGGGKTIPQHRSDGACVEANDYDPIKCAEITKDFAAALPDPCAHFYQCQPAFVCDSRLTFICDNLKFGCDDPQTYDCDFSCVTRFAYGPGPGRLCPGQEDHKCPDPNDSYECPSNFSCRDSFDCNASTIPTFGCPDTYDCYLSYGCIPGNVDCSGGAQVFNCPDVFGCTEFNCRDHDCGSSADKFDCTRFHCTTSHDCDDAFECDATMPADFSCSSGAEQTFSCDSHSGSGDNYNGLSCRDGESGGFACPSQFYCEGLYTCTSDFSCDQYDCNTGSEGKGAGFICHARSTDPGFDCSNGYNCDDGLDFKCEQPETFGCEEFTCSVDHVFRCIGTSLVENTRAVQAQTATVPIQ